MVRNNKKIIIILIIVVLIVVLGAIGGILFFGTDLFKSNKQAFTKYASQLVGTKESFFEESIKEFYKKKENTSYSNEGKFYVKADNNQNSRRI